MKRYNRPELESKQETTIKRPPFPQRQMMSPKTPINPIILQKQVESESGAQQDGKFSMQQLCKVFIERVGGRNDFQFEAKELIELTGVKQRRIYDLMNILQGCDFLKRISKGTYVWFGFEQSSSKKMQKQGRKKQATSLCNLAARVKYLLFHASQYLDFKDICQKILQENNHKFNPDSIKRRVYECCKILKILGLIDKKQHTFRWIANQDQERTHYKNENVSKGRNLELYGYNDFETCGKEKQKCEIGDQQRLISLLIKPINTEQQLQDLLKKIKEQYIKNAHSQMETHIHPKKLFQ